MKSNLKEADYLEACHCREVSGPVLRGFPLSSTGVTLDWVISLQAHLYGGVQHADVTKDSTCLQRLKYIEYLEYRGGGNMNVEIH